MVNTINTYIERNKELAERVEELEKKINSFPSREQQLKVLNGIEDIAQSLKEWDKEQKKLVGWMWKHKSYCLNTKTFKYHEKQATSEDGEDYSKIFIRDVAFHLWNEEQKRDITEKDNPLESYLRSLIHSFSYMTGRVIHGERKLAENEQEVATLRKDKRAHEQAGKEWFKELVSKEVENKELKEKEKELEAKVEELEERVDIEVEMNLKALDKSQEWHDRRVFVENMKRDCTIIEQRAENDQLRKKLDAYEKKDKIKQVKKLANRVKIKVKNKVDTAKEKFNTIKEDVKQKFDAYILQNNK